MYYPGYQAERGIGGGFSKVALSFPLPLLQDKLLRTLMANYLIWPAVHCINFKLVPPQYRVLYNNAVAIVWNAWISWYCSGDCSTAAADGGGADQAPSQPQMPSLPCQQHRSLPFESGLAAAARQTAAVERLLGSWGLQVRRGSGCRQLALPWPKIAHKRNMSAPLRAAGAATLRCGRGAAPELLFAEGRCY